jgi:site-specific recombinase XerC
VRLGWVFKSRATLAAIEGRVHPHMFFRHICATHLLNAWRGNRGHQRLCWSQELEHGGAYTSVNMVYFNGQHAAAFPRS